MQSSRRSTVYDVAKLAGVSIATVSFAFRHPDRVRPSTRGAVYDAARTLGYAPSRSARQLVRGAEGVLGLYAFDMVLPSDLAAPSGSVEDMVSEEFAQPHDLRRFPLYVDEIQHGFQLESMRQGLNVLIGSGPSNDQVGTMDIAGSVDGLGLFPGTGGLDAVSALAQRMPVVVFSVPEHGDDLFHIRVDNETAMRSLVDHLVGHHRYRDLRFVGALEAPDIEERFGAFQRALDVHGIPVPEAPFDPTGLTGARLAAVRATIEAGEFPRVLVCATDQLALTVLDFLQAHGVAVPGDIAVTGFDGIAAGRSGRVGLTTVRQPFVSMGRLAVRILLGEPQLAGQQERSHVLSTRLLVRASCGC